MFDNEYLYEMSNSFLTELKPETLSIPKGRLFKEMQKAGNLPDGWYAINTATGNIEIGPVVRAYMVYDKAVEKKLDPKDTDIIRLKNSKHIVSRDFAGQTFTENFPAGWYIVNKNDRIVERGPVNESQARLHSRGDYAPKQATGIFK
jgi:hypothetical protein